MTEYTEEFCEVDGYRCLMPIEYELVIDEPKRKLYKKVMCNCHNVREGRCDRGKGCKHFLAAKDTIME